MAQSSHGGSHRRSRDHDGSSMRYTNTDWEAKEALYQRELDEARARATQMEKTMRWWSDCTANWREKWSKVRNERNKARDEAKQFKNKVDVLTKELAVLRTEKTDLEQQLIELKKENEKLLSIGESRIVSGDLTAEDGVELRRKGIGYVSPNEPTSRQRASLDSHKFANVDNVLANKLGEMRLRLDETFKNLQSEKDQKAFLLTKVESLTAELHNTKMELTHNDRTLGSDSSHSEVERLQNELQDEIAAKQVLEEKIAEYKMEVERLKSENNIQWSKRELLETENIAILRENKKLYSQVCELREQIHKLNRMSDGSAYGLPFNEHNRLDSNVLYVRKTSVSPRSHESSNGSSEANLAHYETKTNTSGEDDELAIVERNEN
ncbi:coiled-coil domain-containing protein 102A-like [Maniola jurtina]|uniref:coiled-coil domain-containing protein 102A-like n=1 Tax=Maniola jurtina TaxID=191418 RepID=UPI001E68EB05|nr:coiled-coil domain-containing protein 102A-like [Maniola jurtina]XP_045762254.1 coiled-coil domain-containing protein 102A-like [Maniola jurtina]XP_045762255.1 coiled-coil domain-containing protein 102A-like [Maniola jurtina]XP_045762256.1 coiled-coil domain-containing protein 102A-like [Maniola jurtina]